jgi:hypothetical protein
VIRRLAKVNEYGHPLRPLRQRIWYRLRYWGIPISPYRMPPCPHEDGPPPGYVEVWVD